MSKIKATHIIMIVIALLSLATVIAMEGDTIGGEENQITKIK